MATFESISTGFLKKILLVAVVRDMSHTLPTYLAQRVDPKLAMPGFELTIVHSFVRRIVDMTDNLIAF